MLIRRSSPPTRSPALFALVVGLTVPARAFAQELPAPPVPAGVGAPDTTTEPAALPANAEPTAPANPESATPAEGASPRPAPKETEEVLVAGTVLSHTAGSAQVLRKEQLERFEYDDAHAILMQVPGVYMRGEDGMGLRPNLGIRGGNPDRSKKLTLMEDGVLFGPAPYSAPAAYYFPLLTRMTQVRVIKGPGAIAYGPHTVGGAIDLVSRPIPTRTTGSLDLAYGQYEYTKAHGYIGSGDERLGFLVEGVHLGTAGFAQLPNGGDTGSQRNDWMVKVGYTINPDGQTKHRLQAKLSYADEVSNETYLGQTDADFRTNPYRRYAASQSDQMKNHRTGVVLTHTIEGPESSWRLKTDVYRFDYTRKWNKLNRLGGAAASPVLCNARDPAYAGYYGVLTGRIDSGSPADTLYIGPNDRTFVSQGIQSVLSTQAKTGPIEHRFESGIRFHYDSIDRLHTESGYLMQGGSLVPSGEAVLTSTNNKDQTHAVAVHLTDAMTWRDLTLTPGARVELISSESRDRLTRETTDGLTPAVMPGIGAYYALLPQLGVLAGVYRGFSPPPAGSGASVKPEYSVNYEAGARYVRGSSRAELIGFFNDYSNLTDICTLASGCVAQNLDRQFDAGAARTYGLEAYVSHEQRLPVLALRMPVSAAYTLTDGEFKSDFQSLDPIYGVVRSGDSIPYIPLHQLNVTVAIENRRAGINGAFNYVAPMREQAGNQPIDRALATDEQIWVDFGGYVNAFRWLRFYANLRNAFGAENIVGRRPYGARVNAPQWLQVGAKLQF